MFNIRTPYYDNQYKALVTMSSADIKDNILHPYKYNLSSGNTSLELWNKGNTATSANNNTTFKTIYSPSPANYAEPKSASFTGFTISGGNTSSGGFNVSGSFNRGWNFYCQPNYTGNTIFFYTLGNRYYGSGGLASVNDLGLYRTIGPASSTTTMYLSFNYSTVWPINNAYEGHRAYGMSLRLVLE